MLRGLYTAASGMIAQGTRNDVIANNLANVDTAGFHRDAARIGSFPEMLLSRQEQREVTPVGTLGTGARIVDIRASFVPGQLQTTNNPLDVALVGSGFFAIETPVGNQYTRDGRFTINSYGWLTTIDGSRVLGERGPIHIGDGTEVEINSEGIVSVDGTALDRLLVVEFPDRYGLMKQGSNRYLATPEAGQPFRFRSQIAQGSIEMANVNLVREMVNMIEVQRAYEANQKVVQAFDETLGKAVNEIKV